MSFRNTKTPAMSGKKAKWQVPRRVDKCVGCPKYYLEGEIKERFIKLFPKHSNRRLMEWFGISFSTLQRFKKDLGLEKDMTAIRKELAKDVVKICRKNGYYDSLKGKRPSEACLAAARKMRAEGFNPLRELKEKSPKKFRNVIAKNADKRRALIHKEKLRMKYGLERLTKLRLSEYPMKRAAASQKWAMIHKRNYFAVEGEPRMIAYDCSTQRSERMEATARKHGLEIVKGED